jgi:hypothetical protein
LAGGGSSPGAYPSQGQSQYQAGPPYQAPGPYRMGPRRSPAQNFALGCLIALLVFMVLTVSCTRSCLGLRHFRSHAYRHYY